MAVSLRRYASISSPTSTRGGILVQVFGPRRVAPLARGSPDAFVPKPVTGDFLWSIDVAQIYQYRVGHYFLQPREIECPELLPFCHYHQSLRTFGTMVRPIA